MLLHIDYLLGFDVKQREGRNELHANFLAVYLDNLELSENIIEAT